MTIKQQVDSVKRAKQVKRLKLTLALSAVLLMGIAAYSFWQSISQPSGGVVKQSATVAKATPQNSHYSGKYISFTVPAGYRIVPQPDSGQHFGIVYLLRNDRTSKQVAIGLTRSTLNEDTGVTFRKSHPETYHQEITSGSSLVFTSPANGSERTIFIAHGDMVLSISLTDSSLADLKADGDAITASLTWN